MKTDSQLQQDVMSELKCERRVQATQVGVEVQDSVVTSKLKEITAAR